MLNFRMRYGQESHRRLAFVQLKRGYGRNRNPLLLLVRMRNILNSISYLYYTPYAGDGSGGLSPFTFRISRMRAGTIFRKSDTMQ